MPTLIDPAERARRLGNVARILIDLARREQMAESGECKSLTADDCPVEAGISELRNDD